MTSEVTPELFASVPDQDGRFGRFGGKFVAETLMSALADLDGAYTPDRLILDFSGTWMLSSAVLGVLMERFQLMNGKNRQICVCGLSKETQDVFDMTQLSRCIKTFPTVEAAING